MAAAPSTCLLVTGPPGVGKTTLVTRAFEALRASHPHLTIRGFYTREVRESGERVGFEVVTLDGRSGPLASSKISSPESVRWPTVGKYKVDVSSLESLALPELQVKEGTDLFIIDEVGKMELFSSAFFPAVMRVIESNIPVLATIPVPRYGRDIPGVARLRNHPGAAVFTLNAGNRDTMREGIYNQLSNLLQKRIVGQGFLLVLAIAIEILRVYTFLIFRVFHLPPLMRFSFCVSLCYFSSVASSAWSLMWLSSF